MPVPQGVWGIDIGQSALKALRLEMIDGVLTATAFDYVEHPKILSQPDADPDQLTREALEKFLSRNNIKGDAVAISVPGQSGLARFVKLPPVEEKKIGDIVRFEAKQQIPFPLDEVVWDFQKIGSGEVTDGFAMETEIGLFAMKRDQINRALAQFTDVKVEVHYIQMAPLALCNFVAYDMLNKGGVPPENAEQHADEDDGARGKKKCVVALDVGTDSSNLVITDGERIIWQRPIPLGGNHLTRALSKELKLTFAKAEHLKRNAAKSPPELKTILAALKPVLTDFVGEVQRSLGFFTNTHREARIMYMVGLGSAFRLPGLQKYLSEKLQLEVRKPNAFNRLVGDDVVNAPVFTENLLGFAVPYGLALQGAGQAKLYTNLLPQEIQFDRKIRAKKPWAVAAASALLLGTGLLTAGYAINYAAVTAKPIEASMQKAKGKIDEVGRLNNVAAEKEKAVSELTKDCKGVIAGKEEQLDWLLLNQAINRCLPQPDGSNLKAPHQIPYWNNTSAKLAASEYRDRVQGGQSADQPLPEDVRENLVLVDIEAVNSMYTDNLKQFFDNAQRLLARDAGTRSFLEAGMCKYDVDNPPTEKPPPDGGGWIIEIRGSTYQKANRQFILDTLLYNLTVNGRKKLKLVPDASGSAAPAAPATPSEGQAATSVTLNPDNEEQVEDAIIKDRITHAFLYNYWTDNDPRPGVFKAINKSYLKEFVSGPQSGGDRGAGQNDVTMGAAGGGAQASARDTWSPLTSTSGSVTGMGAVAGGPAMSGRGMGDSAGGGALAPIFAPAAPSATLNVGGAPTTSTADRKPPRPRYEFVILFIWREPTPSDQLMELKEGPTPTAPGQGGSR